MLGQTIDNLIPLMNMLPQPAFCLREGGAPVCNAAAQHLAPRSSDGLLQWLGDAAPAYTRWNGSGVLELPVEVHGLSFQASLRRVSDGIFFLLAPCAAADAAASALTVTSQVLRQPLADLSGQVQYLADQLEEPGFQTQTAAMQRQLYRISRIAANLADLEQLRSGTWRLNTRRLDIPNDLVPFVEELSDLCQEAGRELLWKAPRKALSVHADPELLKRALLNLISNALKYSPAGTAIALRAEAADSHLLLQVENVCDDRSGELLHSAFNRLEQRDLVPDPRWGVGLGLPIVQAIARLHGGMAALEVKKDAVTVTVSLSRQRPRDEAILRTPSFSYSGGMSQVLLELSDALPNRLYHRDAL